LESRTINPSVSYASHQRPDNFQFSVIHWHGSTFSWRLSSYRVTRHWCANARIGSMRMDNASYRAPDLPPSASLERLYILPLYGWGWALLIYKSSLRATLHSLGTVALFRSFCSQPEPFLSFLPCTSSVRSSLPSFPYSPRPFHWLSLPRLVASQSPSPNAPTPLAAFPNMLPRPRTQSSRLSIPELLEVLLVT
jgi:hypothetical protein